ncbi:hypothetical protein BS47DRAFT_1345002 [Hydnum rufescens UP504]|uniref:Uncharacterized protein n=1 Tax=Hydnum rufescens UP504 TaxID=1448309 RepID=A0A9P6AVF5_9AGAM|nr:hypothetical protein BS47DRAFT_1345002 [Hydnum rufescens UP504]
MPDVRIKNETPHILNIALSQVAPLHFSNAVAPGETFATHTGSVWFTVEWRIDNVPPSLETEETATKLKTIKLSNRYSAAKSAKTIGIVTAAGLGLVALAVPAALSTAAAAGSTSAAALLASSAVLSAASTPEAIAFSTYAASTLTASAIEAVCEDHGVSPETSEKLKQRVNIISSVVSASSLGGAAAKKGPKKALLSAGTAIVSRMAAHGNKKAAAVGLLPPGKTERVYGVYISFKPRSLAIREACNDRGEMHMQLWDVDKGQRLV